MRHVCIAIGVLSVVGNVPASYAQQYPTRPVRLVTSEPGGSVDFVARIVAQGLTGPLGHPVIVENRGGGGGISGDIVTGAPPDGHTLLVTGSSFWGAPAFRKTTYDPIRGFTPVSALVNSPNVLVVHPPVAIKSVKDLIDMAKARPGQLNYGSGSIGSSVHLAAELFKSMTGTSIVQIPYKGAGPAVIALMSGQVQLMFATAPSVSPHIKSGKLRAIAVSSARTSAVFPDLPTIAATVPGYETGAATAMFGPPRMAAAIVSRLNRELAKALQQQEVKDRFLNVGSEVVAGSPQELANALKSDLARLTRLVKDAGIRVEP